jgi:hypothetical protein
MAVAVTSYLIVNPNRVHATGPDLYRSVTRQKGWEFGGVIHTKPQGLSHGHGFSRHDCNYGVSWTGSVVTVCHFVSAAQTYRPSTAARVQILGLEITVPSIQYTTGH